LLRFFGLLVFIAAIYFAQYIFDYRSLAEFFPDFVLQRAPGLADYARWLTNDLLMLALILTIIGGLGFGLLAPSWRGVADESRTPRPRSAKPEKSDGRPRLLLAAGGAGAFLTLLYLWMRPEENALLWIVWFLALVSLMAGLILFDRQRTQSPSDAPAPQSGWIGILIVLAVAALLFGWRLATMPLPLDNGLSEFGLTALALATGRVDGFFLPGPEGLPFLSHWLTALFMFIGDNVLLELRLSGLIAGLTTVMAVWLLGREIFLRRPLRGQDDDSLEDDGGWIALLAAALLALGYATIHFSRLPHYIEPAAWGTLGFWLLLRGLRVGSWLNVGASALLLGLAALVAPSGLTFVAAGLLWWLGVAILRPALAGGTGRHFYAWLLALFATVAPVLGAWLNTPARLIAYLRAPALMDAIAFTPGTMLFGLNLRRTLFAFNYAADTSSVFGLPTHLLHSLLAPLLVLAIGALLVNLDTWAGWSLLSWMAAGVIIAAALSPRAPFAPLLTPLLPAVALAMAFAIDRVRATAAAAAGAWIGQAVVILALGVIGWAGLNSWANYYQFANTSNAATRDVISPVARAAHASDRAATLALVNGFGAQPLIWDLPALKLASADLPREQARITLSPDDWPDEVAPQTRFLLQPVDRALLSEIEALYPGGIVSVDRDLHGNPVVYIVEW